ncbi:MAG TPA: transcriptional regulator [Rhodospirillaceae bacterium]|nr:DNA-binding protein [Magnetovibrio sp.]HBT44348.1 transcriptional regulator [Rhodospirillaceae bacterium]HCS70048.1 transcriptional regulator [Rhodospirillaceae bacterium]|tara:strand:- start:452 stop:751 length:300 start_codon:yes stop_codon:yes gene_type:complete
MTYPQGMHPEDIKAAIRKTGITLTELAMRNGLSESAVRMAIIFNCCPAGERAVIERLGVAPHAIWPERYDREGNRLIGRDASNSMKSGESRHRQKRRAG